MSDYCRVKALRYKPSEKAIKQWGELTGETEPYEILWALRQKYKDVFSKENLDIEYTYSETCYLDLRIEYDYGNESGEWGKSRKLYPEETEKFKAAIKLIDNFDAEPENMRLVEYSYYNSCEPDDYFDETTDSFYKSVC